MDDRFRRDQTASNDCQVESQLIHITASPPQRDMSQLDVDIAALQGAATHDLRIAWRRLYRGEPPRCMTRELMIHAIAYRCRSEPMAGSLPPRSANCTAWSLRSKQTASRRYASGLAKFDAYACVRARSGTPPSP